MPKVDGLVSLLRTIKPTASNTKCHRNHLPKSPTAPLPTSVDSSSGGAAEKLKSEISSILNGSDSNELKELIVASEKPSPGKLLDKQFGRNEAQECKNLRRKEIARLRKGKWFSKSGKAKRIDRVILTSPRILGSKALQILEKLGHEIGENEYASLIQRCLDEARASNNANEATECISSIYQYFKAMKVKGVSLKEETYGPVLLYLIDNNMEEDFGKHYRLLNDGDRNSNPRLGYYEMRLYMQLNDEEKINKLCVCVGENSKHTLALRESYLMAICESDSQDNICQVLKRFDITHIASLDRLINIFKNLGRLKFESLAENLLHTLKESRYRCDVSVIISSFATTISNLSAEEAVSKFEELHRILDVEPSLESYAMIVNHCCDLLKVHLALDIVERMDEAGMLLSLSMVQSICRACDESYEFNLVRRIYSLVCRQGLKPDTMTFRWLISLTAKMRDFDGAFKMLGDLKKMSLKPVAGMYNVIMGGYFREKDADGALKVLRLMESEGIEPDSSTYSYLIGNCDTEDKIVQLCEKLKTSGVKQLKQVFIARINAFVSCGQFQKAKEVVLDPEIPASSLHEIKGNLVQALASHRRFSDALTIYQEMKQAGCAVDPKAVIALIEHFPSGSYEILLELLQELRGHGHDFWVDGCYRAIQYFVRRDRFSSVIDLLVPLVDRFRNDDVAMECVLDEVFAEIADLQPPNPEMGFKLLRTMKMDFGMSPSRKALDFLLHACSDAGDLEKTLAVWEEYEAAGLPHNVVSYLRMYKALLASGCSDRAGELLSRIPKDDFHVCLLISASNKLYPS